MKKALIPIITVLITAAGVALVISKTKWKKESVLEIKE